MCIEGTAGRIVLGTIIILVSLCLFSLFLINFLVAWYLVDRYLYHSTMYSVVSIRNEIKLSLYSSSPSVKWLLTWQNVHLFEDHICSCSLSSWPLWWLITSIYQIIKNVPCQLLNKYPRPFTSILSFGYGEACGCVSVKVRRCLRSRSIRFCSSISAA